MQPLVSVIIPGYNHAPYLRERIDSVLAQDYPNYEVIMLDDRSSDNSAEVMLSYKDHEHVAHVEINEQNSGNTFLQWDKGINLARGEYIWIAESDDVAKPTFLSECMARLSANPDAVAAFSWSKMIGPDSQDLGYSWDETQRYQAPGIYDGKSFCLQRLVYKNLMYNASMIVFAKKTYYNVAKDYQKFRHSGDWLFWYGVCMQGKVCEVPHKLSAFRQHPNKVSNHSRMSGEDFREMGAIQSIIINDLKLSNYQISCLRGRQTKRLNKSQIADIQQLKAQYPQVYGGTFLDKILYTFDKILNLSHLVR